MFAATDQINKISTKKKVKIIFFEIENINKSYAISETKIKIEKLHIDFAFSMNYNKETTCFTSDKANQRSNDNVIENKPDKS